jgi:hypothetical protein
MEAATYAEVKEPSIASTIRAAGFDYRPSRYVGKREVFNVATGEIVGQFEAHEALDYARAALSKAGV